MRITKHRPPALTHLREHALIALGLLACFSSKTSTASPGAQRVDIAIVHVAVVDTRNGRTSPNMTVMIRGGRITSVAPSGYRVPAANQIIDARGKFLVPGYNDMHGHPLNQNAADSLILDLVNGVTGVRQMSGTPELLQARRDGKLPTTDAASILAMPGYILTRSNAGNPTQAVAEIQRQKGQGADFIKVIDVSSETFDAVAAESKRVGLPFLGHLPAGIEAVRAAKAGFRSIEHLGPNANILISCSTDQTGLERAVAARPAPKLPAGLTPAQLEKMFEQYASAPLVVAASDQRYFQFLQHVVDTFDDAKCRGVVEAMKRAGTWQSPTLIRERTIAFAGDSTFTSDPALRYVPVATREQWAGLARRYSALVTPANREVLEQFYALQVRLLKMFDASGTPMIAGSDQGGQWDIAGFSLHRDFDLLAAAGLSPLKILQMTTINAGIFLGRERTLGRVEVGAQASLVLLNGNPVEKVANLHAISAVVHRGRLYNRDALDALLRGVAQRADRPRETSDSQSSQPAHTD